MGEAQIRTAYDAILAYQITVPGSGSAYANISSLLTANQKAEIASLSGSGYFVCGVIITPSAAINWEHALPGTPGTLSPDSNGFPILANQKPNELIPMINAHINVFLRAAAAGTVSTSISLLCVSKDTL